MKTVFDSQLLLTMNLFEKITRTSAKDCVVTPKKALFVVSESEAGKAIGREGKNIKKLEKVLKRKVKIVEFSKDISLFVKNLYYPLRAKQIVCEENTVIIEPVNTTTRGSMIGRGGERLRAMEVIVKRHFPLEEIKVTK